MPTVPVYGDFKVQQGNTPTPTLLAPDMPNVAAKQTQQMGEAISNAGAQLSKIEQDQLEQANRTRVLAARNELTAHKQALTYGDDKIGERGFVNIRGYDALNPGDGKSLDAIYNEKYGKKYEEVASSLSNDAQRAALMEWADADRTSFNGGIAQHIGKESNDYNISVHKSAIELDLNDIALDYGNADLVISKKENIKQRINDIASITGMKGLPLEMATMEALTPAHMAVIEQSIDNGDIGYAEEYLLQAKENKEITGEALLKAESLLAAGDFAVKTQNAASMYINSNNFDFNAALKSAKEGESGKERDEIVRRIKIEQADRENMKVESQKNAAQRAYQILNQPGGKMDLVPESVKQAMNQQELYALKDREARTRAGTLKSDREIIMNMNILAATNEKEFANLNLGMYSNYLDDSDWDRLTKLQGEIKAGKGKEIVTDLQLINKFSSDLKGDDKILYFTAAEREIRALGSSATMDQKTKAMSNLRIKGEYKDEFTPLTLDFPKYKADPGKVFVPNE